MPFVAPEVIKLDLRLVQENPTPAIAAIVHAVNAESERSGAALLAEGIETPEQREIARASAPATARAGSSAARAPLPTQPASSRPSRSRRTVRPASAPASPSDAVAGTSAPAPRHQAACCSRSPSTSKRRCPRRVKPPSSSRPTSPPPFVARDLGDPVEHDMARRFDYCLTSNRDLAVEAARGLLARVAPR